MIVHFEYSTKDFEESAAAQNAFFTIKVTKGSAAPRKTLRWGLSGWILFIMLATILVYLVSNRNAATTGPVLRPAVKTETPTHNFLLTLIPAMVTPLLVLAWYTWLLSKPGSLGRVPLFTVAGKSADWRRTVMQGIIAMAVLLGVGGIAAFWFVPIKPDWSPNGMQLFLVYFLPWAAWPIVAMAIGRLWRGRVVSRTGNPEHSTRLPQKLEISDAGIYVANTLLRQEFTWPYIVSYLESENLMTLFTRDLAALIVPKRAFADDASLLLFFGTLQSQVPQGRFLPRESAFPVRQEPPIAVLPVDQGNAT